MALRLVAVAESHFAIAYDGPALETGRMPVRDLAPALLALGALFSEASEMVYPTGGPVGLSVKATEQASFDVHLVLDAHDLWNQFIDFYSSDNITALANLQNLILGSTVGLFAVLRRIGHRRIDREEESAPTPGQLKVTLDDGTSIEMPVEVARMVRRISIRRKVRDVVAPLARDGVERVTFAETPEGPPELVIDKDDFAAYEAAAVEEGDILLDEEREMIVQIASVSLEGKKWRLSDGNVTFWASVEDSEFLADVEHRAELFGTGDMLRCRIRVVQSRKPTGGLRTEYHVVQVLRHIPGDQQMNLEDGATDS